MGDIVDFNKKIGGKPMMDVMVFACPCKTLTQSTHHSVFHIYQTGYECANCGMYHSFENVHGKGFN